MLIGLCLELLADSHSASCERRQSIKSSTPIASESIVEPHNMFARRPGMLSQLQNWLTLCQQTSLVPCEAAHRVLSYLGVQIPSRHGLHDQQGLLGLDAGTQEGDDIGMATRLEDHYLLDETRLLGRSGASHNLDGHICGTIQHPQVDGSNPSCTCLMHIW